MQLTIYLALNVFTAIIIAFTSYRNLKVSGGKSIFALSLAALFCFVFYLQLVLSPSDLTNKMNTAVILFGMTLAATLSLTFSLEYTQRLHWINRLTIFLLAIVPLVTQIVYWAPETIVLLQKRISLLSFLGAPVELEKINLLYRYSLLIATVWLLGRTCYLRTGIFNFQFWSLLAGPLIAFITQGLMLLGLQWAWLGEISLISVNLSAIGFAYNVFRRNSPVGLLVRRGSVVENMQDGWIVLDMQNSIIDSNQATVKMSGVPRDKMIGKSITSVLFDFPDLVIMLENDHGIEMDRTVKINYEYYYLNIRVSTLKNNAGTSIGRLVIWRDITDRRRAEDARQQARDEMFVLLNAISSTASQTSSLSEFLSDAIYQIIYPFRSQTIFIYLLDERSNSSKEEAYYLAAHLGLSNESSKELSKLSSSFPLVDWTKENQKHLLVKDLQDDLIPEPMRALPLSCLLVLPLIAQNGEGDKFLGLFFLGRTDKPFYKPDEIVRLSILADQIATLIDSDRRRKLSIALSERQRLMRDIHDSVSQKLYGLVTLTEAAKAAREAGAKFDYGQFISRIGENARQAVKELRLFLFQMQPIDLEKEGLISVLHHRLAAVEGRADVKARFLADEPISLSKEKELALYYIAQEALNNVLRHAFAKSVSVTLKQGYKFVTFEVRDDGCGFDNTKLERGGIGLKNITERVKQENGKLKISSKPGKGTIIKVTFEKDLPKKSGK